MKHDAPRLVFFRETPSEMLSRPPLGSSLQHLETSFHLVALGNYPHALAACAAAVESGIKAWLETPRGDRISATTLHKKLLPHLAPDARFNEDSLKTFREARNDIMHFGFSPKDDDRSAALLLSVGYPLVEACYEGCFDFSLRRVGPELHDLRGLIPDFDKHLTLAQTVYEKSRGTGASSSQGCFAAFAHYIRWMTQHWSMADWQINAEELSNDALFDAKWRQRQDLEHTLNPAWVFDCPVCDASEFVCGLRNSAIDQGEVVLEVGYCVNCAFLAPRGMPILLEVLCGDQVAAQKAKILEEFI